MIEAIRIRAPWILPVLAGMYLVLFAVFAPPTAALTPIATPSPKPGSYGIEATKTQPPPTQAALLHQPVVHRLPRRQ